MRHELKTWPEFFQATLNNKKKFELRKNDRDFKIGDELLLQEWDPEIEEPYGPGEGGKYKGYTGMEVLVRVDYIMTAQDTAKILNRSYMIDSGASGGEDYVIMSTSLVP